jgi:transposase
MAAAVRRAANARVGLGHARLYGGAGAPTRGGPKKSDPATECLGRSRGGVSTKVHACVESLGNAVRLLATEGQAGDSPQALPLLADLEPGKVLADTAYDSDATRAYCAQRGIEAVIPSHPNRTQELPLDKEMYRDRNKVERFFGRLKQYRRLATRYDKTVVSFLAFWHIGAMLDWLR